VLRTLLFGSPGVRSCNVCRHGVDTVAACQAAGGRKAAKLVLSGAARSVLLSAGMRTTILASLVLAIAGASGCDTEIPDRTPVAAADESVLASWRYLGRDVPAACAVVGYDQFRVDQRVNGTPGFVVGGTTYARGLFAHADSDVSFILGNEFRWLHLCAAIPDEAQHCSGGVDFAVWRHDQPAALWQTSILPRTDRLVGATCIDLDVGDVSTLRLTARAHDGNASCDHASWVDARVLPRTRTQAYLGSDVAAASATVGYDQYRVNGTPYGTGFDLGGVHYERGLFAHAPSVVRYPLAGEFNRLDVCVGITDQAAHCSTGARYRIVDAGGNRVLWDSGPRNTSRAPAAATCATGVDVTGVSALELRADPSIDATCDHVAWVNPRVYTVQHRPHPSTVGAIYWAGFDQGSTWGANLGPSAWSSRLPLDFGRRISSEQVDIREDLQEVMDGELVQATLAGIDYFAFAYYDPESWPDADRYNYGLRNYLNSPRKDLVDFALILQVENLGLRKNENPGRWPETVRSIVELLKKPTYQRVLGGRPVVYLMGIDKLAQEFGSVEQAITALDQLNHAAGAAGTGWPYLVVMSGNGFGWDAGSAYALANFTHGNDALPVPYAQLAGLVQQAWDRALNQAQDFIPTAMAGWDPRPRRDGSAFWRDNYDGYTVYQQPTALELSNQVCAAVNWNLAHPDKARANSVLVYAWNELDEGGYLVPTVGDGGGKLHALAAVLAARAR